MSYQNTMPPTEPWGQADPSSLEDAISYLKLDLVNQYKDLYPDIPFMQPVPPTDPSGQSELSPLDDAMLYLRLNSGNPYGDIYLEIALLQAVKEARLDIVEELLEKGINAANARSDEGPTSLFHATGLGFKEIVASLLQQGASMDKQDEKGRTLLFRASLGCHVEVMSFLLDNGAEIDLADEEGWTPLMVAAERGNDEAVALLLKHGADPNARDKEEFTPILHAAMIGYLSIVERLLDAGADPNAQDEAESLTAMSWAAESGHGDVVKLLLERGADPNVDDRILLSALSGCEPDDYDDNDALIEMLVKHEADVFMDCWSDERPLVIAARQDRHLTVELFLEASYSSRSVRQEHIWDAITVAAEQGHEAILESLMRHYEPDETEKQTPWEWAKEYQFGQSYELLRPYFEPEARTDNGSNKSD